MINDAQIEDIQEDILSIEDAIESENNWMQDDIIAIEDSLEDNIKETLILKETIKGIKVNAKSIKSNTKKMSSLDKKTNDRIESWLKSTTDSINRLKENAATSVINTKDSIDKIKKEMLEKADSEQVKEAFEQIHEVIEKFSTSKKESVTVFWGSKKWTTRLRGVWVPSDTIWDKDNYYLDTSNWSIYIKDNTRVIIYTVVDTTPWWSDWHIQYNNDGSFWGDSSFTWSAADKELELIEWTIILNANTWGARQKTRIYQATDELNPWTEALYIAPEVWWTRIFLGTPNAKSVLALKNCTAINNAPVYSSWGFTLWTWWASHWIWRNVQNNVELRVSWPWWNMKFYTNLAGSFWPRSNLAMIIKQLGDVWIWIEDPEGKLHIVTDISNKVWLIIEWVQNQTWNLLEFRNSDWDIISSFSSDWILHTNAIITNELSADPADPAEWNNVQRQSDGTGSWDDGDIMMKITAWGVTKTTTLVDFSAL